MTLPPAVIPFEEWTLRGRWWPNMRRHGRSDAAIVHHSVTNTTGDSGLTQIREIEEVIWGRRFKSRFSMVAYSWLIDTHGVVYEGRGTEFRNGANNDTKNTGFGNSNTMSFCFAGNYQPGVSGVPTLHPTPAQLGSAGDVMAWLEMANELSRTYRILPHRHVHATSCPGDLMVEKLPDLIRYAKDQQLGAEMFVTKSAETDSRGRVWFGSSFFETSDVGHWEDVVGPSNVYVSRYMQALYDGMNHPAVEIPAPVPGPAGPSADTIADKVIEKIRTLTGGIAWG